MGSELERIFEKDMTFRLGVWIDDESVDSTQKASGSIIHLWKRRLWMRREQETVFCPAAAMLMTSNLGSDPKPVR
jgi:hypothetical protein